MTQDVSLGLQIDHRCDRPVYAQLVEGIKGLIFKERLAAGCRLPTVRALAAALDINPNTVARTYRELEREGVLDSRVGRGTFVSRFVQSDASRVVETRLHDLERELSSRCVQMGVSEKQFLDFVKRKSGRS